MNTLIPLRFCRALFSALILLVSSFLLAGCSWFDGHPVTVTWSEPKAGVQEGVPVRYQSVQVGEVKKVTPAGRGMEATIKLRKKYAHYVRVESTFLVRPAKDGQPLFIEVVPLNPDSAPAPAGAKFQGADSELAAKVREWTTDWKRTAIYVGIGLGAVVLLILISRSLFKMWAMTLCLAGGAVASVFLTPYAQGYFAQWIPADARPDLLAYVAMFALGYLAATILISLLKAPLHAGR
jgi:hypothetical protein